MTSSDGRTWQAIYDDGEMRHIEAETARSARQAAKEDARAESHASRRDSVGCS